MLNVIISYSEKDEARPVRYEAGPYPSHKAKEMEGYLRLMGCTDFKFHPTNKPVITTRSSEDIQKVLDKS